MSPVDYCTLWCWHVQHTVLFYSILYSFYTRHMVQENESTYFHCDPRDNWDTYGGHCQAASCPQWFFFIYIPLKVSKMAPTYMWSCGPWEIQSSQLNLKGKKQVSTSLSWTGTKPGPLAWLARASTSYRTVPFIIVIKLIALNIWWAVDLNVLAQINLLCLLLTCQSNTMYC